MSHEMMENDSAAYFETPAWHGLGRVVTDTMSISGAMKEAELDWEVRKRMLFTSGGVAAEKFMGIQRTDTQQVLGVVSPGYKTLQNHEAFALAKHFGSNVTVESAGSIQNGSKVYLLLRGDSFDASYNKDEVQKYMALFWGHDGTASLTVLPTSIRVVCKNTLDMVMGAARGEQNKISISHAGDIDAKIAQAEKVIQKFKTTGRLFQEKVQGMARTTPSRSEVNSFFLSVYKTLNNTEVNLNPVTEKEKDVLLDAHSSVGSWTETFELESQSLSNWSYWTAANAVSNNIQHRVAARGRKASAASSAYNNLIGKNAKDTTKVFNMALASV